MNVYQKMKACIIDLTGGFDEQLAFAGAGGNAKNLSNPMRKGFYEFKINDDGTIRADVTLVEGEERKENASLSKVELS